MNKNVTNKTIETKKNTIRIENHAARLSRLANLTRLGKTPARWTATERARLNDLHAFDPIAAFEQDWMNTLLLIDDGCSVCGGNH